MRVLYVGTLWQGSTCLQRFGALKKLNHLVIPFDVEYYFPTQFRGLHTVQRKLCFGPRVVAMNNDLARKAVDAIPDIIWFDKALLFSPDTLQRLKMLPSKPLLIHYSPDDMMNPDNQSRFYPKSISLFDLHITHKSYNVNELKSLGATRVYFMNKGFDPDLHMPVSILPIEEKQYGALIGVIGSYERQRAQSILRIAQAGYRVRIWGNGWEEKCVPRNQNLMIEKRPLWGDEYVKAICATKINLCFLRKVNRDLQTARSIEIPACGGFMIAERTDEHLELFKEDEEAVYFSTDEELCEKIKNYVKHPDKIKPIAKRGRLRCINSKYSYSEIISGVFSAVEGLNSFPENHSLK